MTLAFEPVYAEALCYEMIDSNIEQCELFISKNLSSLSYALFRITFSETSLSVFPTFNPTIGRDNVKLTLSSHDEAVLHFEYVDLEEDIVTDFSYSFRYYKNYEQSDASGGLYIFMSETPEDSYLFEH